MNFQFFTIIIVEKSKNKFLTKYNMIIYFLFKILYYFKKYNFTLLYMYI